MHVQSRKLANRVFVFSRFVGQPLFPRLFEKVMSNVRRISEIQCFAVDQRQRKRSIIAQENASSFCESHNSEVRARNKSGQWIFYIPR
jgi:hypothetical protein